MHTKTTKMDLKSSALSSLSTLYCQKEKCLEKRKIKFCGEINQLYVSKHSKSFM